MNKIIVNPDHFRLNAEQLYVFLCKKILAKKFVKSSKTYEIYSADDAGIQYLIVESAVESHILKEEMMKLLSAMKSSHEFSVKSLKDFNPQKQAAILAFMYNGDVVY